METPLQLRRSQSPIVDSLIFQLLRQDRTLELREIKQAQFDKKAQL